MTRITRAPGRFDGSLGEFYERWAKNVFLPQPSVEAFHNELVSYLSFPDPLFLTRGVTGQERGADIRNREGHRLRATDNAPAWWIHAQLFNGLSIKPHGFATFIESVPCHLFKVDLAESINSAGWHVAHIFNAKDGNTEFEQWDRRELIRRMVRSVHPCNYFYLPKVDWRRYGGDPVVVAFFYEKLAATYHSVWDEFMDLVAGSPRIASTSAGDFRYRIPIEAVQRGQSTKARLEQEQTTGRRSATDTFAARYKYSRLAFKADVIEPLAMDDIFCVDTPDGSYAMSKREFYEVFPLIPESKSYREDRLYSFPKPPHRAQQFRISTPAPVQSRLKLKQI